MVDMFVNSGIEVENRGAFLIAIFFDDLVYQPSSHQNEVQSAEACGYWLKEMGVSQEIIKSTEEFILASAGHNISAVAKDVALFLDLDLAILSATEDRYQRYAQGIRREYETVPERKYCLKRAQFLRDFARRESIYSHSNSLPVSDERARANLCHEADILEKKAPRREGPWYNHVSVVTGTVGSGKSSVLEILKESGAFVVSADDLVRELKQPGKLCHQAIVQEFGVEILDSTGAIDNKKLADIVFANDSARSRLNDIIHPAVWELAQERFERAELDGEEVLIFEVPLYFEAGWDNKGFKHSLVVSTPDAVAIERIMSRNQLTQAQAEDRLASQLPAEEKILRADFNIRNDNSIEQLRAKVEKILPLLKG